MSDHERAVLGYPKGYPKGMSQSDRDWMWCRIQAGKQPVAKGPVHDLAQAEEIAQLLDCYWTKYKGEVHRLLTLDALAESGVHVQRLEAPADELELLLKPSQKIEPQKLDLLRIPTVRAHVDAVKELFAEYDRTSQQEYASLKPSVRSDFESKAKKRNMQPWEYYRWVRKYYFRRGITDLPARLNVIVPGIRFLGRYVGGAHPELRCVLREAEKELDKMGIKKKVAEALQTAFCFVPRPQNNLRTLSPHALGRAMDVDAKRNPHLIGSKATAVDKILEWLEGRGLAKPWRVQSTFREDLDMSVVKDREAEMLFDKMHDISESIKGFLDEYLPDWEEGRTSGKEGELEARPLLEELLKAFGALKKNKQGKLVQNKRGMKLIREMKELGLITIQIELFKALKLAGNQCGVPVRLGIEYNTAKDVMHIEVMPDIPRLPKPACLRGKGRGVRCG